MLRFGIPIALGGVLLALLGTTSKQPGPSQRLRIQPPPIVWIEGGSFTMGASDLEVDYAVQLCIRERPLPIPSMGPESDGACAFRRFSTLESPRRSVHTEAYGIDRTEVTHRAWRSCVVEGRCPPSRVRDDDGRLSRSEMPVTGVSAREARVYCEFRGGRLPTEAEWERAARGTVRNRFPWGRHYNSRLANHGRSPAGPDEGDGYALAAPVGSFPAGASAYGLLDMAGNAWEWTESSPSDVDLGMGADPSVYRVVRGGSWNQPPEALRVTHRAWVPGSEHRGDLGFRCAYDGR